MPNRKPRILIIDDDNGFCRLVKGHMERAGFEVVCANTAEEGSLLFWRTVSMSSSSITSCLSRMALGLLGEFNPGQGATPVVYLTGSQIAAWRVAALKAGAADYVA